ncbi:PREDICTED: KIF1-binding protein homolog [Wasmannia auropunctata]|uniref:KIF1-binding protein homolog n=1 Tax=Wasmannia auropunctata TaxID=64793 RepID=UPI0005EFACD0|nr:PREDICTED: KIF1-binding protein homolog [Wasmannia auropunctata]
MDECLERISHPGSWVKEKYQEVQKLLREREPRCDPNKLYERKLKAVEILMEILEALMLCKETLCTVAAAITYLNIGVLQADIEDTGFATEHFKKCADLLGDSKLTSEGILPAISANNQLGLIYAQRGLYEEAKDLLKQAEDMYVTFTEDPEREPVHTVAIIDIEELEADAGCARSVLERLHTFTLYYLAQVYRELDDKRNFALYCHRTLSKQLSRDRITRNLDYVEWALNAATISQYFIEQDKFPQARHHLAAASHVLGRYSEILRAKGTRETSESVAAEYENYEHRSANIARCWAKYGIALLTASRERLLKRAEQEDEPDVRKVARGAASGEGHKCSEEDPRFVELEPELESITSEITDKYLLDFNDARPVFLNVRKWLDRAREYYTFENHASDYAWIAQDLSQAYKYLAFFEDNEDRQARMHKRRIDTLEEVIEGLYPRFYRVVCREIWLELAATYSEILDLKIDRLEASNEKPTAQMVAKIERLARSSIRHYQSYLNSLDVSKSECGVESFSDDLLHSALYTHFLIGRLYNKIITPDVQQKIENMQNCVDAYNFIVDYYDKHPEKQETLKKYEFMKLSREFVTLLPLTLERLKQQQANK